MTQRTFTVEGVRLALDTELAKRSQEFYISGKAITRTVEERHFYPAIEASPFRVDTEASAPALDAWVSHLADEMRTSVDGSGSSLRIRPAIMGLILQAMQHGRSSLYSACYSAWDDLQKKENSLTQLRDALDAARDRAQEAKEESDMLGESLRVEAARAHAWRSRYLRLKDAQVEREAYESAQATAPASVGDGCVPLDIESAGLSLDPGPACTSTEEALQATQPTLPGCDEHAFPSDAPHPRASKGGDSDD